MPFCCRVVQLHQVANDELVEVDDFLPQFRQLILPLMQAIPASPHEARTADDDDAELILATRRAGFPRRREEIAWIEPFLWHMTILCLQRASHSEQKANMLGSCVVLRTCTVAVKDLRDVEHSIEVTATLYEAIATALAALQHGRNWVGDIGPGFTTGSVLVQQAPVKHEVKMKDFVSWLGRQGRSPAEVVLKQKLEKILGKANHART